MNLFFSMLLLIFLALIGLVFLMKKLQFWATHYKSYKEKKQNLLVTKIKGHQEDAEFVLRGVLEEAEQIFGRKYQPLVLCLDCGADLETRKICEIFCKDNPRVKLLTKKEFFEVF